MYVRAFLNELFFRRFGDLHLSFLGKTISVDFARRHILDQETLPVFRYANVEFLSRYFSNRPQAGCVIGQKSGRRNSVNQACIQQDRHFRIGQFFSGYDDQQIKCFQLFA